MQNTLGKYSITQVTIGDPTYIRTRIEDFSLTSPNAKEWMLTKLRGPKGVAEVIDLTLLEDGIVFELSSEVADADEAKEVARRTMLVLGDKLNRISFEDYCGLHGTDFDPMAVSSVDTTGLVATRFGHADG